MGTLHGGLMPVVRCRRCFYPKSMPRNTTAPQIILALSPHAAARAIGVSYERNIVPAIASGHLPVRCCGTKRRILVRDIEAWIIATWPLAQRKGKTS